MRLITGLYGQKNLFQPSLPCMYSYKYLCVDSTSAFFLFCCCFVYTYCPSLDVVLEPGVQGLVSKLKVKIEVLHSLLHRSHSPPVRQGQRHLEVHVRLLVLEEKMKKLLHSLLHRGHSPPVRQSKIQHYNNSVYFNRTLLTLVMLFHV